MKYNKALVILLLLVIVNIIIINSIKDKEKSFTVEGVELAVKVDGVNQSDFPNMGEYNVSVDCTGITGTWNYSNWRLELSNMSSNSAACNINFISSINTHTKLNTKIIDLVGTNQGDGQIVNENGYRYEGKDPNNYVLFNNELWRIIGVFDDETHGVTGQYLTKIIRNESIGSYSWNSISGGNDWNSSSLKEILNNYYYNNTDGTGKDECYLGQPATGEDSFGGNCNFTGIGLNQSSRDMIASVIWKLGGYNRSEFLTAEGSYNAERGSKIYNGNSVTWEGYIGLMYPSDYGYSILSSSCNRNTKLSNYFTSSYNSCVNKSWIFKYGNEWTLMPYSDYYQEVFFIDAIGNLSFNILDSTYFVRPTAYLKSSVYIVSGDGSQVNPYILRT